MGTTRSRTGRTSGWPEHPHGRGDDIAARKASCPLIGEGKAGICCDGHLDRLALASPAWALVAEEVVAGTLGRAVEPGEGPDDRALAARTDADDDTVVGEAKGLDDDEFAGTAKMAAT